VALDQSLRKIKQYQQQGLLTPIHINGMVYFKYDEVEAIANGVGERVSQRKKFGRGAE
jgi:hypothetical protein